MRILVLGRGKTGTLVATVARERNHSVHTLDEVENNGAAALTPALLATFDVVIDFTTPEAAVSNLRACLSTGAKIVIGTTGWYAHLDAMRSLAERKHAGLLYGTNFSFGVQLLNRVADLLGREASNFHFHIEETHHVSKKDAPSGTALSLQSVLQATPFGAKVEITSHREGDAVGLHRLDLTTDEERISVEHIAHSRRCFAVGAVRAAEWLSTRTGCYNFSEVFPQIL